MAKSLRDFYQDTETKDNVRNYLIDYLEEEAIKKVFGREDVSAVADAKEIIDKAFFHLEELFDKEPKKNEPINQAR